MLLIEPGNSSTVVETLTLTATSTPWPPHQNGCVLLSQLLIHSLLKTLSPKATAQIMDISLQWPGNTLVSNGGL